MTASFSSLLKKTRISLYGTTVFTLSHFFQKDVEIVRRVVLKWIYRVKGGAFVADWKKIKKEYIAGGTSYKELSEKYGVSQSTMRKTGAREHWADLRNAAYTREEQKVVEEVSSRNARFDDAVDLALEAACEYLKSPGKMRAVDLKDVTSALKNLRDLKGIKNDADVEEQRARIEALRARAAMNKPAENEDEQGGVILLPAVDDPPGGPDGG